MMNEFKQIILEVSKNKTLAVVIASIIAIVSANIIYNNLNEIISLIKIFINLKISIGLIICNYSPFGSCCVLNPTL